MVFAGLIVGSIIATFLYQSTNAKAILIFTQICNSASLLAFTMTSNFIYLILSRFATGMF